MTAQTPIAREALASLRTAGPAPTAALPTLADRLSDLDAVIDGLDNQIDLVGHRLQPILTAPQPVEAKSLRDASGDSDVCAHIARVTERLEDLTEVLGSIRQRVQL